MEETRQKVRQAAGEVTVAAYVKDFEGEADNHQKAAWYWLGATILISLLTVGGAVVTLIPSIAHFLYPVGGLSTTQQVIQFTVSKLIILSVLYYTLVWCARNYSAHRHNYIVNRHRRNSLNTFEAFVKAVGEDRDTKNAVLLQATQSIFSSQASGYALKDFQAESPSKFIEIMRSVGPPSREGG
jgi:hypothetical protein